MTASPVRLEPGEERIRPLTPPAEDTAPLEQWRQDLYTALGVSPALTPGEIAAQVRQVMVDLAAERQRAEEAEAVLAGLPEWHCPNCGAVQRGERDRLTAQVERIRALHRPLRIYDECGHTHTGDEPGVKHVSEIGTVCEDGYQYTICAECCADGGEFQRMDCVDDHPRGSTPCWPCPTLAALDTTQDGGGTRG